MPRVSIDDRRRWPLAPTTGPVVVVPRQPELPVVRVHGSAAPTVVALPSQHVSEMPLVIVRQSPAGSQRLTRPQAQCLPRQPQQSLAAGGTVTTGSPRPLPVVTAEGRPVSLSRRPSVPCWLAASDASTGSAPPSSAPAVSGSRWYCRHFWRAAASAGGDRRGQAGVPVGAVTLPCSGGTSTQPATGDCRPAVCGAHV